MSIQNPLSSRLSAALETMRKWRASRRVDQLNTDAPAAEGQARPGAIQRGLLQNLEAMVARRHVRRNVAALLLGVCVLSFAAAAPGVSDWHGMRARLGDLASRLGLGPANAQPRPTIVPIKAIAQVADAPPVQALRLECSTLP